MGKFEELQEEIRREQVSFENREDAYRRSKQRIEESYEAYHALREGVFHDITEKQEELYHALGAMPYASEDDYREALNTLEMYGQATETTVREKLYELDEQLDLLDTEYRKESRIQEDKIERLYRQLREVDIEEDKTRGRF